MRTITLTIGTKTKWLIIPVKLKLNFFLLSYFEKKKKKMSGGLYAVASFQLFFFYNSNNAVFFLSLAPVKELGHGESRKLGGGTNSKVFTCSAKSYKNYK